MDTTATEGTPSSRRSTRLQNKRDKTPEPTQSYQPRGPRAMAMLNKSKKAAENPKITITVPTPSKSKRSERKSQVLEKTLPIKEEETVEEKSADSTETKLEVAVNVEEIKEDVVEAPENKTTEENERKPVEEIKGSAKKAAKKSKSESVEVEKAAENENKVEEVTKDIQQPSIAAKETEKHETYAEVVAHSDLNSTPQLMDTSVISIPDTPPSKVDISLASSTKINNSVAKDATFSPEPSKSIVIKDSTFSPEVDSSLHDSRPHIDEFNTTPTPRNIPHRTSTPLAQKIFKRDTPKAGMAVMSSLAKVFSPKGAGKAEMLENLSETLNGQFKVVNPLEKSILKSSRKRSLSVTDGESFVQKRVMFVSPKIMDIGEIDEKMMQSFLEEKENSMMRSAAKAGRKRSMSASDTPTVTQKTKTPHRKHIPNFKAIHEAQFKKMESIFEHKQRKQERAKRLITPSKSLPAVENAKSSELETVIENPTKIVEIPKVNAAASKIPTRKPLSKLPANDPQVKHSLKRSMSEEPTTQAIKKKFTFVSQLPRSMSQDKVTKFAFPSTTTSVAFNATAMTSQSSRGGKIEDRREKNISLYKTNTTRSTVVDVRKKNINLLKGVRLNRRFQLQMQQRALDNDD